MKIAQIHPLLALFILCCSSILTGCARTESENITSHGIHADIQVSAGGNGTTEVEAQLTVGRGVGGTLLELSGGDRLLAHANGITQQMVKDEDLLAITYKTSFNFNDADTQFRVEFDRSEEVSAPNSVVTLPLPPNITMPVQGETILQGADLTVAWEPAFTADSIRLRFLTTCQGSNGARYSHEINKYPGDTGSYRINTVAFVSAEPDLLGDTTQCDLDVTVYRERGGSIDPNYGEGGRIIAIQRRAVIVQLVVNPANLAYNVSKPVSW
ncbi:hypothetical protein [Kaarinaea lacus]